MAYTFEFPCENCSKVHKKTLPNKSSSVAEIISGKRKTFCSRECKKEYNRRNNRQTAHCENCGDIYRFFPSSNSKYCSRQCLSLAMKEDPVKFGLHERAEHMRKETDKQEATKKMLETKLEKGLIVDWNNATWKQWYRRCNAILQKRRKEMVEEWDGYDYIDMEQRGFKIPLAVKLHNLEKGDKIEFTEDRIKDMLDFTVKNEYYEKAALLKTYLDNQITPNN